MGWDEYGIGERMRALMTRLGVATGKRSRSGAKVMYVCGLFRRKRLGNFKLG